MVDESALLDLKHLLMEAQQRVPPVLMALEDPDGDMAEVFASTFCSSTDLLLRAGRNEKRTQNHSLKRRRRDRTCFNCTDDFLFGSNVIRYDMVHSKLTLLPTVSVIEYMYARLSVIC